MRHFCIFHVLIGSLSEMNAYGIQKQLHFLKSGPFDRHNNRWILDEFPDCQESKYLMHPDLHKKKAWRPTFLQAVGLEAFFIDIIFSTFPGQRLPRLPPRDHTRPVRMSES
jgi:hypothetical protein